MATRKTPRRDCHTSTPTYICVNGTPMSTPRVTQRRTIAHNRFFDTIAEDLATDQGDYTYHSIACRYDAVIVVPELPDGRLLVERIWRQPYGDFLLEFPAGGIEPGEDPLAAAARELEEETGYRAGELRLVSSCEAMPGLLRMRLSIVHATGVQPGGTTALEPLELLEVLTMTKEECWDLIQPARKPLSSFFVWGIHAALPPPPQKSPLDR